MLCTLLNSDECPDNPNSDTGSNIITTYVKSYSGTITPSNAATIVNTDKGTHGGANRMAIAAADVVAIIITNFTSNGPANAPAIAVADA